MNRKAIWSSRAIKLIKNIRQVAPFLKLKQLKFLWDVGQRIDRRVGNIQ